MIAAIIILSLCVFLMLYSYLLYPILLKLFSIGKKQNEITFAPQSDDLPMVHIIFSAYNEEKVIAEKLESIYHTSYPSSKFQVWIGSDNSSDQTDVIIGRYATKCSSLHFTRFEGRNGKSKILNLLVEQVFQADPSNQQSAFILTDANVLFSTATIYQLVKHFKNEGIGQVAANILNKGVREDGISFQEKSYIQRENEIKYLEGLNWGTMIGAFGAGYAMRASGWKPIPPNTLMEDFYLSLYLLQKGFRAIKEKEAVCYEDVSNDMMEEFKRKTRIQAGNFQNLKAYWRLLFRFNAIAFCFFSHKIIRWFGPLWITAAWFSNLIILFILPAQNLWYPIFAAGIGLQTLLLATPVLEKLARGFNVHWKWLRFAAYFYLMNFALAKGFWTYIRGVKSGAWSPTKRNLS